MLEITIALIYQYKFIAFLCVILFIYVLVQRIKEYKNDKYKDVEK
jgi:hypothetical protein